MMPMDELQLAGYIDHSLLKATTTPHQIGSLCREAVQWRFVAVCIPPAFVREAASLLQDSPVHVGTVIGFPLGYNSPSVKVMEARSSQEAGAGEIDMVMNLGRFKAGDFRSVEKELQSIISATPGLTHKVIIECASLTDAEKRDAVRLIIDCGAAFVKTSTGFGPGGATQKDVRLLAEASQGQIRVKASGGIADLKTALVMIDAGAARIGTTSAMKIMSEYRLRSSQS
jgi:deoxyribose-phosphate aldolase